MKKEWFLDRYCGQQFAALLEDGQLMEFTVEREKNTGLVGNIYKGRVMNVLTGMQAAFISCGLERNCYLPLDENYDYSKYDGTMDEANTVAVPVNLKPGDEVIVQIVKPARGNKGAKVTTHLSFVGKNIIFLPNTAFLGISRKITDPETREKFLDIAEKMRTTATEGFIVRTAATEYPVRQLKSEAEYLRRIHHNVQRAAIDAPVGSILYKEFDLPFRVMRDSSGDDVTAVHVGNKELYDRLLTLVRMNGGISERKVSLYTGERSMMKAYGISDLMQQSVMPTVPLQSGGYLVIEHTEAMTVVDVNTGSYVGDTCLEETVFKTNLEAAKEIARQVRLRNIGGIVAVDFIDMANEEHKQAVTDSLTEHLNRDRAKCRVLPMSELCITQFTRKRVGNETLSYLVKPCPACEGRGYLRDDMIVISFIRADILDCFASGYKTAIIELNDKIMKKILREELLTHECKTIWADKRVYMIPHRTYADGQYSVIGDNSGVLTLPDKAQVLY